MKTKTPHMLNRIHVSFVCTSLHKGLSNSVIRLSALRLEIKLSIQISLATIYHRDMI